MPDPKHCPFCAKPAVTRRMPRLDANTSTTDSTWARCPDPECAGYLGALVDDWNRRAPDRSMTAQSDPKPSGWHSLEPVPRTGEYLLRWHDGSRGYMYKLRHLEAGHNPQVNTRPPPCVEWIACDELLAAAKGGDGA